VIASWVVKPLPIPIVPILSATTRTWMLMRLTWILVIPWFATNNYHAFVVGPSEQVEILRANRRYSLCRFGNETARREILSLHCFELSEILITPVSGIDTRPGKLPPQGSLDYYPRTQTHLLVLKQTSGFDSWFYSTDRDDRSIGGQTLISCEILWRLATGNIWQFSVLHRTR